MNPKIREALEGLVNLYDEFQTETTGNMQDAYYTFYKGKYELWDKAKEARAALEALNDS